MSWNKLHFCKQISRPGKYSCLLQEGLRPTKKSAIIMPAYIFVPPPTLFHIFPSVETITFRHLLPLARLTTLHFYGSRTPFIQAQILCILLADVQEWI